MATLIVAAAVMVEDARVLLTRRPRGTHLAEFWEFPGGKVEDGEDPRAALARELGEEIGVAGAVVGDVVDVAFWRYPARDVLLLFFRVERASRAGAILHLGVSDHAWVGVEDLDAYPLPPADVAVLAKVRALLRSDAR